MSTFVEMQDEVLDHGFGPEMRPRVKNWLNQGQARIARMVNIRELLTKSAVATVSGTQSYTLPVDFVRLLSLVDDSGNRILTPVDPYYIESSAASSDRPYLYALSSEGLMLYPTPNLVLSLTLRYFKGPTVLAADGDISLLPPDYHDVMVSYALSRAYRTEDDAAMSQFHFGEFLRDLQILSGDRTHENLDPRRPLDGTWNSWISTTQPPFSPQHFQPVEQSFQPVEATEQAPPVPMTGATPLGPTPQRRR